MPRVNARNSCCGGARGSIVHDGVEYRTSMSHDSACATSIAALSSNRASVVHCLFNVDSSTPQV